MRKSADGKCEKQGCGSAASCSVGVGLSALMPAMTAVPPVKANMGEVHWQKRSSSILDGRESLFLKIWVLISSFPMAKAEGCPRPTKKSAAEDADPYADLFR